MRSSRGIAGALAVLWLIPALPAHADPSDYWHDDLTSAQREAQRLSRPLLLHFYADWCFPCRRMDQEVFSEPGVMDVLAQRLVLVKVNVDKHPEIARRYNVMQYPSDVVVDPAGERIISSTGYLAARNYVSFATSARRQYLAGRPGPPTETEVVAAEVEAPEIALDGFSPVTLWEARSWVKGDERFSVEHRGQLYYLTSAEEQDAFRADPQKYVPRLLGCDAVILHNTEMAIPGSVRYGAYFDGELYLFASDETRQAFKDKPDRFTRTRVVLRADQIGESIVR